MVVDASKVDVDTVSGRHHRRWGFHGFNGVMIRSGHRALVDGEVGFLNHEGCNLGFVVE